VEHELKDIRYQSRTYERLETLMNRVNEETLKEEHRKQVRKKATGVDGMTKDEYGEKLEENVAALLERMKKFSYKPLPVRRVYIPKANGKMRPIGIPSYEDKLVQGVMAGILNDIYEERFLDCSYGFRPGRSTHDAVKQVDQALMARVGYVLEADIKGFFDNVSHEWLMKFLEHDIADKNFLRYIKRFLIAGVNGGNGEKGKRPRDAAGRTDIAGTGKCIPALRAGPVGRKGAESEAEGRSTLCAIRGRFCVDVPAGERSPNHDETVKGQAREVWT
jgi:retron-type reverse transcriptase